ncbi:YhcN/YlaJ family sporulation lipoprotein [Psychrobacillus sp. NPDC096426]|uniref:YhcN/YlaJ family sporulation lipoprotein n=1 Tax=Psychrobacillus sp. NPDC096426 TaxID=3364491 RepID=UPI003829B700
MIKLLQISMVMLLVVSLAACGTNKKTENVANNGATTTDKVADTNVNTHTTTDETVTNNVNDVNGNEGHKLELADDVADKIAAMKEVERANVIVTNHNAYVAVELKEGTNSSEELEKKIADEARATNGDFHNVYVSTNPDFAKQFREYGEKIRANEPVEGFFKEFSDTVKRVFPDAH